LEQRGLWNILIAMALLLVRMELIEMIVHSMQRTLAGKQ
jgi:hypothetical protein